MGKILEDFRVLQETSGSMKDMSSTSRSSFGLIPVPKKSVEDGRVLSGLDGVDVFLGLIQCYICKKLHQSGESWIGPVNLQLSVQKAEGEEAGGHGESQQQPAGGPVLRLFMHQKCCKGLENHLVSQQDADTQKKLKAAKVQPPRAKNLLKNVRDYDAEYEKFLRDPEPESEAGRRWKASNGSDGKKPVQLDNRFSTKGNKKHFSLGKGEYNVT